MGPALSERVPPAVSLALVAGVFGAVQPKVNAVLGTRVGSALVASLVNFGVALAVVVMALAVRPSTRRRLTRWASWDVPRWTLSAGLGGALVVLAGAVTVETIGVAVFSVAFFGGQISFGLLVDRLGLGPGGQRAVTAARGQATVLALLAVLVSQIGQPAGQLSVLFVVLVVGSGAGVALQSAFNGRITTATGDALAATAVNVAVGTLALAAVAVVLATGPGIGPLAWPAEPWLYAGGLLGVTIVFALAAATAAVGVLGATLTMLAAQMVTAFVIDWAVLQQPPAAGTVVGAVVIVVAVRLVGRRPVPVATPPAGEL